MCLPIYAISIKTKSIECQRWIFVGKEEKRKHNLFEMKFKSKCIWYLDFAIEINIHTHSHQKIAIYWNIQFLAISPPVLHKFDNFAKTNILRKSCQILG